MYNYADVIREKWQNGNKGEVRGQRVSVLLLKVRFLRVIGDKQDKQ